jgi:hypothetical protein
VGSGFGVEAPGGVELVEPIWSFPSSLFSLVALCGISEVDDGMVVVAEKAVLQ